MSSTSSRRRARRGWAGLGSSPMVWIVAGAVIVTASSTPACASDDTQNSSNFGIDASTDASGTDAESLGDGAADARGPFDPRDEEIVCDGAICVRELVAGDRHFCARLEGGTVRCWGDDTKGQLGRPNDDGTPGGPATGVAPPVADLADVVQISAAGATTCARLADGGVRCWGGNEAGELGLGTDPGFDEDPHPRVHPVDVGMAATRVDVGQQSVCAIANDGRVICWGNDFNAQLARADFVPVVAESDVWSRSPGIADLAFDVTRTSAGRDTGLALTRDGVLVSWGAVAGASGVLSGRTSSISPTPTANPIPTLAGVSSFAVSGTMPGRRRPDQPPGDPDPPPSQHACAVADGDVFCWGRSERGALGTGLPDAVLARPTKARLRSTAYAQQVAVSGETTCARMTDGTVACAGENVRGQLGSGTAGPFSSTFSKATSLERRAVRVAVANATVCALLQGGAVSCWGSNENGELGASSRDEDPHPSATMVSF